MLMHKNQRGFSIAELIILVVVVGALGGGGWYVASTRKAADSKKTDVTTETASTPEESNATEEELTTVLDYDGIKISASSIPEGWKTQQCVESSKYILPPTKSDVKCNSDDHGFFSIGTTEISDTSNPPDCSHEATRRTEYSEQEWYVSYDCEIVTVDGKTGVKSTTVENEMSMLGAGTVYYYSFRLTESKAVVASFVDTASTSNPAYVTAFHDFVKSLQFDL